VHQGTVADDPVADRGLAAALVEAGDYLVGGVESDGKR
jgi:hypothetical protein